MKTLKTTLWVSAGLLGLLALVAAPAAADNVINDDCIIIGSQCIGFDCVNGESFGFDTLRLKENNLRIHFLDTSSTASFPDNDWRIVANDSSNGGAEYLGIEDSSAGRFPFRVFAGARADALVVDAQSDIGIGTSNPVADVHIKTGNTPTLRLEQDGTSGFNPQTWDVAGNEANFFIRDATSGSTLPVRIRPGGAPSSSLDIAASGDIGMGTSSPSDELHVRRTGTGATRILLENANAAGVITGLRLKNASEEWQFFNLANGNFTIRSVSGAADEITIDPTTGNVTFGAQIFTATGNTCDVGCDAVFSPEYEVESINDHAASMWQNSHLPAVGPTPSDGHINLTQKTTGILNELEKAHIYIEQLHKRLEKLEQAAAEKE